MLYDEKDTTTLIIKPVCNMVFILSKKDLYIFLCPLFSPKESNI